MYIIIYRNTFYNAINSARERFNSRTINAYCPPVNNISILDDVFVYCKTVDDISNYSKCIRLNNINSHITDLPVATIQ